MSANWLVPDWPAPANVRAVFTTRSGGTSNAPWDSLNFGDHVGDMPEHVAANRSGLQRAIASRPVFLNQVHGVGVAPLDVSTPDGIPADACMTDQRGVACVVTVADCLPVLLTRTDGACVAAAHAGWRGLAGVDRKGGVGAVGVLEALVGRFSILNQLPAQLIQGQTVPEIIAWLGPCIGPTAFEVGAEVVAVFAASQPRMGQFFKPTVQGKYLADLAGLARARLQALGVAQIYGNDSTPAWCTVGDPSRFFSHRRDAGNGGNGFGTTGRMAACVWLG